MAKLKPAQIAEVKGKGFLINRGTENFSLHRRSSDLIFREELYRAELYFLRTI